MDTISERYEAIRKMVEAACEKAGRDVSQVKLIAVSKNFPAEDIQTVYDLGQRRFGENRAQEMAAKYPLLPQDIVWHFIGRLQRNKVKYIIDKASMIHSVDSLDLAKEISRQAVMQQIRMPILIQVNLEEEATKAGFQEDALQPALKAIAALPNLQIRGLMTIGPYHDDPEDSRPLFKRMKALLDQTVQWQIPGTSMDQLSMGMSHDFGVAIEEGATFVRVGSSIFGYRIY
jgi:hypothetical protein